MLEKVNSEYEYEEQDLDLILGLKVKKIVLPVGVLVYTLSAVDNITPGQLLRSLQTFIADQKIHAQSFAIMHVLIPYNLGNYHWIGLMLILDNTWEVRKVILCDPKGKISNIPVYLKKDIQILCPNTEIENIVLLTQPDNTSCGVVTIENLVSIVLETTSNKMLLPKEIQTIREQHLELIKAGRPNRFQVFYERQRDNKSTVRELPIQLQWLTQGVKFSSVEYKRIFDAYELYNRIKITSVKEMICCALADKDDYKDHVRLHLSEIRRNFILLFNKSDLLDEDRQIIQQFITLFFCIEPANISPSTISHCDFHITHEELRKLYGLIQKGSLMPLGVVSVSRESIEKQILADKALAKQLQVEEHSKLLTHVQNTSVPSQIKLNKLNQSKSSVNAQHARFQAKQNDIRCLQQMEYELRECTTISSLNKLVNLCGGENGLSFNDYHDESTYYIRNRYGFRVRNKGNALNENEKIRIDFEMLFRFKALLERDYKPNFSIIKNDLKLLHSKVKLILWLEYQEDPLLFKDIEEKPEKIVPNDIPTGDLLKLAEFISHNYPELILKQLTKEAEDLSQVKEINKETIYFISRKLIIIGELFHEYSELFPELKRSKKFTVFSLFNRLNNFRNRFIHFDLHITILQRLQGDSGKELKSNLLELSNKLTILFKNIKSLDDEIDNARLDIYKSAKNPLVKLAELLSPHTKIRLRKEAINILSKTNKLLLIINSQAHEKLFTLLAAELSKFEPKNELHAKLQRALKEQNPAYLIKLIITDKSIFMDIFQERYDHLVDLLNTLKELILSFQVESVRLEVQEFLHSQDINDVMIEIFGSPFFPNFDINNLKFDTSTLKVFDTLLAILKRNANVTAALKKDGDKKCPEYKLYNFLTGIKSKLDPNKIYGGSIGDQDRNFNKLKEEFKKLNLIDQQELEEEFDFSISNDIKVQEKIKILVENNTTQERLNNPNNMYANKIYLEMQYLEEIETSNQILKDFIIEHIITLIGQYIRDIENIAIYGDILLSNIAKISAQTAKSLRSKGLAHELFNFDQKQFKEKLLRHITPSTSDFAAIATIYKRGGDLTVSKTSLMFAELGDAFKRLSIQVQAVNFYNSALQTFSLEIPRDVFVENSAQNKTELKKLGITQPTAVLIDHSQLIFEISIFELQMYIKIQEAYLDIGDINSAIRIFHLCMGRLNLDKVIEYRKLLTGLSKSIVSDRKESKNIPSLSEKSRQEFFKKNTEYYEKISKIIQRIEQEERPFVILADESALFICIADVFHQYAKALMQQEKFDAATKHVSWSFDFITGETKTEREANNLTISHIPTYNLERLLSYYLDLSRCHLNLGELQLAFTFCNQSMSAENLTVRINSCYLNYFIHRKTAESNRINLQKIVGKCILEYERSLVDLKKLCGDGALNSIELYHKVRIDYYLLTENFSELDSYLVLANRDSIKDFGISLEQAFPNLNLFILQSSFSLLVSPITKERYKKILDIFEYYLLQAKNCTSINSQKLEEYQCLYFTKIEEYLHQYFDSNFDGFLEVMQFGLDMKNNNYYAKVIISHILKEHSKYSKYPDKLSQIGERYLIVATDFFNSKNYELAELYFKPSIELLSYGTPSRSLVLCWYRSGELLMAQNQYSRAVIAYDKAVKVSKNLPNLNFTSLDASTKLTGAIKKFHQFLKDQHNISIQYFKEKNYIGAIEISNNTLDDLKKYEEYLKKVMKQSLNDEFKNAKGYLFYLKGISHFKLNNYKEAKEDFSYSIEILSSCKNQNKEKLLKANLHLFQCEQFLEEDKVDDISLVTCKKK